jgi:hypothetical protein
MRDLRISVVTNGATQMTNTTGFNPSAFTYEQVKARMDNLFAEARAFDAARAANEQARCERRRDELVARGLARAARGRIYDMIQLGELR